MTTARRWPGPPGARLRGRRGRSPGGDPRDRQAERVVRGVDGRGGGRGPARDVEQDRVRLAGGRAGSTMSDGGSIVRQRSTRHRSIAVIVIGLGVLLGLLASPAARLATARAASAGAVVVMPADGEVDNVMAGAIESNLATAAEGGAAVLVIRLNTPGGSLESTQRIVSAILAAKVPTIVWVAPAGGFA